MFTWIGNPRMQLAMPTLMPMLLLPMMMAMTIIIIMMATIATMVVVASVGGDDIAALSADADSSCQIRINALAGDAPGAANVSRLRARRVPSRHALKSILSALIRS